MNQLRSRKKAVSRVALSAAFVVGLASVSALAQQTQTTKDSSQKASSDQAISMDKFVVTGSHLPMAADQVAIPVTTLDTQDIQQSGESISTLDMLRKIAPEITGVGSENATINTATTYGGAAISIHGMPVLVLINGRRIATSSAEAVGGSRFVDLNMIPASAIQRIDVLKDGASAIYGSDAVGGVVNVITKSDYNGWEAGAHYGYSPSKGRYAERSAYLTGGVSNGKTSITVSLEYAKHDPIYFSSKPYTNPYYVSEYYPGIIDIYNLATGVDEDYQLNPKYNAPPGGAQYTIDQLVQMGYYTDLGSDANPAVVKKIQQGFNLADKQTLIQSLKRSNLTLSASHKIFDDKLEMFGDLEYSNTLTMSSLNAQPIYPYVSTPYTDTWYVGSTPPPPGTQYVPVTIPGNPFSAAWINQASDNNTGFGVMAHNRFVQYPRVFNNDSTLVRIAGGFKGQINDNYSWEIGGTLSRYTINYTNDNLINTVSFLDALAQGQLNPFALTQPAGVLPGNILGTGWMHGISSLGEGDILFRGTPFELPAGKLSFAVGASYTREVLNATADLNSTTQGWMNSPSILPINKQRKENAVFAEVSVPIVSKDQHIPGIYSLSTDLAWRFEHYTQVGNSTVPKVSLKYLPFDNTFSLRFSAGKSFLAPQLYDLYGPVNTGSSQSITYTPYGSTTPQSNVQFQAGGGSNPDLKPSTASTWSAGFGYTPKQVKGLSITFDYFQSHWSGIFGYPNQQTIVQDVENKGAASSYANFVHFGSLNGTPVTAPGQISAHPKAAVWINAPLLNLGGQLVKGFDATVSYEHRTDTIGRFTVASTVSAYNSFQLQEMPTDPYYNYVGTASQNEFTVPRWRTYSTLTWQYRSWTFDMAHTYVPTVQDIGSGGAGASAPVGVNSYQQFDFAVKYDFNGSNLGHYFDGLSVRLGINNAFNKMPPVALNAMQDTNSDVGFYGAVGRMVYVDASYKF